MCCFNFLFEVSIAGEQEVTEITVYLLKFNYRNSRIGLLRETSCIPKKWGQIRIETHFYATPVKLVAL